MNIQAFLAEQNLSTAAFAADIGVSQASLYRYMSGDRLPRPTIMTAIVEKTAGKVQPNDFYSLPSQAAA